MTLRREVLGPGPRRAPRNPIPVILALLLIATFASAAMENRQLRRRAEAAEEAQRDAELQRQLERLHREFEALQLQIERLRPRTRQTPPVPRAGDFVVPPENSRTL